MEQVIDYEGQTARYARSVEFIDNLGSQWLRHEYFVEGKDDPVMFFELVKRAEPGKKVPTMELRKCKHCYDEYIFDTSRQYLYCCKECAYEAQANRCLSADQVKVLTLLLYYGPTTSPSKTIEDLYFRQVPLVKRVFDPSKGHVYELTPRGERVIDHWIKWHNIEITDMAAVTE